MLANNGRTAVVTFRYYGEKKAARIDARNYETEQEATAVVMPINVEAISRLARQRHASPWPR